MTLEFCEKDYYGSGRLPSKEQGPMLVKHFWYPESTLSGVDDKK
jgi:hypothetical protein